MNSEGLTSLAVVDNQWNVVGNISTVDVKVTYPDLNSLGCYSDRPKSCSPNRAQRAPYLRIRAYTLSPSSSRLGA